MEMCLKRDCSAYLQSRVFEEMLVQQIRKGNLAGAGETIRCANSLSITITADYVQQYLVAKKEALKDNDSSYMSKIRKMLKGE